MFTMQTEVFKLMINIAIFLQSKPKLDATLLVSRLMHCKMYVNVYPDKAEEVRKQNLTLIPSLRLIISDNELKVCLSMLFGSSRDHY